MILYINDLMYNAFVQQYHTTLFTCQATIILIFFHRKRSLDYTFVLLQLLIKYVYTNLYAANHAKNMTIDHVQCVVLTLTLTFDI